jgi:hypothetical protein
MWNVVKRNIKFHIVATFVVVSKYACHVCLAVHCPDRNTNTVFQIVALFVRWSAFRHLGAGTGICMDGPI